MIAVTLLLAASTAHAECRLEALEAAERIRASGPFHFETTIQNEYRAQKIRGRAVPSEKALEIQYLSGVYDDRLAELYKDGRHWTRDSFGWFGGDEGNADSALFEFLPNLGLIPPFTEQVECPGTIDVDGRHLTVYRIKNDHSLYLDPKTNLIVRYEKIHNGGLAEEPVTTYRYDSTISIQAPIVDLAKRKRASHEAFEAAKKRSDPACRNDVSGALERGLNSGPFHFEFWQSDNFHGYHAAGSFLPSQAAYVKRSQIGSQDLIAEAIILEGKTWWRHPNAPWQMIKDDSIYQKNMSTLIDLFKPNFDEFVFTRCAGQFSVADRPHRLYEFDIYGERNNAYKPVETRRIFIDTKTALPVKSQKWLSYFDEWVSIEQRVYDPEIRIVPPD